MITKDEIQELLHSTETYRVERTTSTGDMDKFQEAICAFANDLPNSRKNAGGLYGNARPENFPSVNDYRNPLVASAMKTLGYVNMFNRGVGQVQTDLKENGNQPAEFNVNLITAFKVEVKVSQSYINEKGGKTGGKVGGDVPSLSQALSLVLSPVCPQLSEVQLKKIVSVIDYLFRASGSITELMNYAGEKNKNRFRQTILKPLVDTGLVEPTIKDVPNNPKQKYALTENGREKFQTIS